MELMEARDERRLRALQKHLSMVKLLIVHELGYVPFTSPDKPGRQCEGATAEGAIAYNIRAWYYHLAGQDSEGLPDANRAVALAPRNAGVIETRAEIYERLGERDKAIADYRQALSLAPNMKDAQDGQKRLGVN
jgi:Tfp pilus assembly protein PilF